LTNIRHSRRSLTPSRNTAAYGRNRRRPGPAQRPDPAGTTPSRPIAPSQSALHLQQPATSRRPSKPSSLSQWSIGLRTPRASDGASPGRPLSTQAERQVCTDSGLASSGDAPALTLTVGRGNYDPEISVDRGDFEAFRRRHRGLLRMLGTLVFAGLVSPLLRGGSARVKSAWIVVDARRLRDAETMESAPLVRAMSRG
jgi:hypothetical protein